MAFFDEMDRKLSQFGQSVSNKSREVSEGMRLSSAIKAEEEKQNNLYREVGKYYFENCAANAEGQLKVLCDQIVASMELTSQYKQQQNVLKGMVSCPNCGAQISANSGFCNVCGSKIEKQVSPAPQPGAGKICPKCQKTVEADALFCTFCGNQFEAQPAAPAYEEPALRRMKNRPPRHMKNRPLRYMKNRQLRRMKNRPPRHMKNRRSGI